MSITIVLVGNLYISNDFEYMSMYRVHYNKLFDFIIMYTRRIINQIDKFINEMIICKYQGKKWNIIVAMVVIEFKF